ncbi:ArsR/SmtB family transcription factor [Halomarina rubra]|uniref:DUF7344 domain-containing protein n=1 Tax=Halomarina rubra TaxID=2071873 RepID=A0ABD6AXT3_9EURY|nr:helix-turn-helix transcriptional regulator [Halomarina rubra]
MLSQSTEQSQSSDLDETFALLSDHYRRATVAWLCEADGPVAVEELAAGIGPTVDAGERRVVSSLTHNHLPRLADAGAVEYHRDTGVVRTTADTERLAELLGAVAG